MIKRISKFDSEFLAEMHMICFSDGWSAQNFYEMLSSDIFFGFIYTKNGFILCKILYDEVEIITFCVLPQFRSHGIGKTLIDKVVDYAKACGVKKIFLEVSEDNAVAKNVYENSGFEKISERYAYYRTPQSAKNAIIMRKNINL